MSPEARAAVALGLRLAGAVALGLSAEILRGALLPPLAAVIALQILALPGPAPRPAKMAGLFGVMAVAGGLAYLVAALTAWNWTLYAIGVGLLYLWGFWLALRPGTAAAGAMALTMAVAVTTISALSTGVALAILGELLGSVIVGIALVYLAHAAFPHPGDAPARGAAGAAGAAPIPPEAQAGAAAAILLLLHLALTAEGGAAMVVLLTVATMLRQPGFAGAARFGANFAAGNLLGGLLAAAAVGLVALQPAAAVLVSAATAGALTMATAVVARPARAPMLLPGFVAFTLLFGLAFLPVPGTGEVAFLARVAMILGAAVYALAAISLVLPRLRPRPTP